MCSPHNLLLVHLFADLENLIEKKGVFFVRREKVFYERDTRENVCFLIRLIMKDKMKNTAFLFFSTSGGHISRFLFK